MKINLHITADFDSVFSINGNFTENISSLVIDDTDVLFITVFPLDAMLLPYTIKFIGGLAASNTILCKSLVYKNHYINILSKRYNYVYSVHSYFNSTDTVCDFFSFLKQGNLSQARNLLSPDLSASIDDKNLLAFFNGYQDIIKNNDYIPLPSSYFLINSNNNATLFQFILNAGLIDNIIEKD